jgi:hypothetical protein
VSEDHLLLLVNYGSIEIANFLQLQTFNSIEKLIFAENYLQ